MSLQNLNLKHLRYFWVVASQGSITKASKSLHLTPQTISGQLRVLEDNLGVKLFEKEGRNLRLTREGTTVFSYADEMFKIAGELEDQLGNSSQRKDQVLKVGIAMVVPKLLAYRVLAPVIDMDPPTRMVCHEAPLVDLLADLSVHKLDLVLADAPIHPVLNLRAFNHKLGESGISFFARESHVEQYKNDFPSSLDQAPFLMPSRGSSLRRGLEIWFERYEITPHTVAEFEDRALMKAFGEAGAGVFTSPTAVEGDVLQKYAVQLIARSDEITESYYAISPERHIKHPAVSLITQSARQDLFS